MVHVSAVALLGWGRGAVRYFKRLKIRY